MDRAKIGIVTGLQAEAQWLRDAGFTVMVGGGTPLGARKAAEALVDEQGVLGLLSFGLAGGLQKGLKPGRILVPSAIQAGLLTFPCDYRLLEFLGGPLAGPILGWHKIVTSAEEKQLLSQRYHVAAVDLESGAVAEVAKERELPFAVLRAVADPAERDLPPAALVALKADGKLDGMALARSILRQPRQIPGLIKVGRDAAAARKALINWVKTLPEKI